jgi:hypothetical protein
VRRCSADFKEVITLAGSGAAGLKDEKGALAVFHNPIGICANHLGEVFVCDYGNNKIRKITYDGMSRFFQLIVYFYYLVVS